MRFTFWVFALIPAGLAGAADVILNEYNAVGDTRRLEDNASDPFWGRVDGNGGDWFETVVITDHLDMRGWSFWIVNDTDGTNEELFVLTLTNDLIWSDMRRGTILTVAEDLRNNIDEYDPVVGRWWLNVKASDDSDGRYITARNFKVSNDNWQVTIRNGVNQVIFGPAGEPISVQGVGSTEVCKLEEDPSASITPTSEYNDGSSSTFGAANVWNQGADVQDFSGLRSIIPYHPLTTVRINEVLTHTDFPLEDWIELANTTGSAIDVGGWYLTDKRDELMQYRIPDGTIIAANGYAVLLERDLPFALDSVHGDEVYLSEADAQGTMTGGRDFVKFGAAENGVSFGRFPDGTGDWFPMSERTRGARNAYPLVGPVVVNEIMYHPPDLQGGQDNVDHEFIELHNVTDDPVDLFTYFPNPDLTEPWQLSRAIDYDFPLDATIPPRGYLLVVSFDPVAQPATLADFLAEYRLHSTTAIVGPYLGKLSNSGERLRLRKPDGPEFEPEKFVPYPLVEEIPYDDESPWPLLADGLGRSLERIDSALIGADPANWMASFPDGGTPGCHNLLPGFDRTDFDLDGAVDIDDHAAFVDCMSSPGAQPDPTPPVTIPQCLCAFDVDHDLDVDLADFIALQRTFGP
jgi:hypothetical protein